MEFKKESHLIDTVLSIFIFMCARIYRSKDPRHE